MIASKSTDRCDRDGEANAELVSREVVAELEATLSCFRCAFETDDPDAGRCMLLLCGLNKDARDACDVSGFVTVIPVEFGESGDAMIGSGSV